MENGDLVFFGRTHGEKTLGRVLKVNPKSVKVEQLESRGTMREYRVGTKWRIAPKFCSPAPASALQAPVMAPEVQARLAAGQDRDFAFMTGQKRPEAEILRDIRGIHAQLSPENLTCDGELPRSEVARREKALNRKLASLTAELGREATMTEIYAR